MGRKIVDATELRPGDKIVTNRRGDVETVTKRRRLVRGDPRRRG